MTTLTTIFDEAFLREKERYQMGAWSLTEYAVYLGKPPSVYRSTTRADCERFILQRAREAGFTALREAYRFTTPQSYDVHQFLASLAGDGDAGKGE